MKRVSQAWLLDCGGGLIVATGVANVLHVVEDTRRLFKVPLAAPHCNRVLLWQQRILPAVDLAVLVAGTRSQASLPYACVLGWRNRQGETSHGVLLTSGLPRQISINDDQQAQPSDSDGERWRGIALGFFAHFKRQIPIINPAALFDEADNAHDASLHNVGHRIA